MKNFVISLPAATERRIHIQHQFSAQKIDFEFFDAVTPEPAQLFADQLDISIKNADLTKGEIACLMSHVCLWQKIVDECIPYAAIFEDDIFLANAANQYLCNSEWLKIIDVNIIKIEAFSNNAFMSMKSIKIGEGGHHLKLLTGMHLGCAGYILSNNAASSMLGFARSYPIVIAVDHIVFENYIKLGCYPVYQMNPAICMQSDILLPKNTGFTSSLEKERRLRFNAKRPQKTEHINFVYKLRRETFRILIQLPVFLAQLPVIINKFLFYRKVFFKAGSNIDS